MGKTIQVSARINQEDAQFLAELRIDGAHTPSDKLRAIIAEARLRHDGAEDYRGCVRMIDALLEPTVFMLKELEMEHQRHSDLMTRVLDWLPDAVGFMVSSAAELPGDQAIKRLEAIESGVADRVFRLMESILQMGVTQRCPCYRGDAIRIRVAPVKDLIKAIGVLEEEQQ